MAIARPTTKTIISTVDWGVPITDEVNRLTTEVARLAPLVDGNTPTAWTAPTFLNGWTNFGSGYQNVQYRKIGDTVYIRGSVKSTGTVTTIFTLPTGFRTPMTANFPCMYWSGSARLVCGVTVHGSGNVAAADAPTINSEVSLNIIFSTTA